ncbi:MAG: sensor histidine kinase [Christensenellales bacterium]
MKKFARIANMTKLTKLMVMLIAAAILLSTAFGALFSHLNRQSLYELAANEMLNSTQRTSEYLSMQFKNIDSIYSQFSLDRYLQQRTSAIYETDAFDRIDFGKRMDTVTYTNSFIDTIDIYLAGVGEFYSSDYGMTVHIDSRTKKYLEDISANVQGLIFSSEYRQNIFYWTHRKQDQFTLIYPLYQGSTGKKIGTMAFSIANSTIINHLGSADDRHGLIIDSDGAVLFSKGGIADELLLLLKGEDLKNSEGTKSLKAGGRTYFIASRPMDYLGWQVVEVMPADGVSGGWSRTYMYALILSALTLAVLVTAMVLILRYIIGRMRPLMDFMEMVRRGNYNLEMPVESRDEFSYLYDSFSSMTRHIERQFDEIYRLNVLQKEVNLRLMGSQINPHFIYNIFNNIGWMAELGRYDRLQDLTDAAATFFRKSLNGGNKLISLADEKEKLESYMLIHSIRFGGRFEYEAKFDREILGCKILNHLLQPLVENAVIHGVEPRAKSCRVDVRGWLEAGELIFEVKDNGAGISEERLENIREVLKSSQGAERDCFALDNVNQRIKLYYGKDYGVEINSIQDRGTIARMRLPLNGRTGGGGEAP